jgi:hypothetical protein
MSESWKIHDRPCPPCPYCGAELYERFFGNGGWVPSDKSSGYAHGNCIKVVAKRVKDLEAAISNAGMLVKTGVGGNVYIDIKPRPT